MERQTAIQGEPSFLDEPWLRRQVETHLVFGFLARRLSLSWIVVPFLALSVVSTFGEAWPILLGRTGYVGLILLVLSPIFRQSRYRQAAIGWCATKTALAATSFIVLLVGGLIGFFRGQADAIHLTLLALLWFPCVEFMSSIAPRQRFLTIARVMLSIPLVILGTRAGGWTW